MAEDWVGARLTSYVATPEELAKAVSALHLHDDEASTLLHRMQGNTSALMIYGSRARGDHLPVSDFDLLRLSPSPLHTFRVGRVSVSSYTVEQLRSATRTLFGTHLIRDGRIILDPTDTLHHIIDHLQPANPVDLLATVRRYSVILDLKPADRVAHRSGLVRLARYLLRTAIYAKAMEIGKPCFSVRELAERFHDSTLATLLASDPAVTGPPSEELLDLLIERLVTVVGPFPRNELGSISALVVDTWDTDRNLAALAVRALSEDGETLNYSDLPKVLL